MSLKTFQQVRDQPYSRSRRAGNFHQRQKMKRNRLMRRLAKQNPETAPTKLGYIGWGD